MLLHDLTDTDRTALVAPLRETVATDRCITRPNATSRDCRGAERTEQQNGDPDSGPSTAKPAEGFIIRPPAARRRAMLARSGMRSRRNPHMPHCS
jgi:hypothetical protein